MDELLFGNCKELQGKDLGEIEMQFGICPSLCSVILNIGHLKDKIIKNRFHKNSKEFFLLEGHNDAVIIYDVVKNEWMITSMNDWGAFYGN